MFPPTVPSGKPAGGSGILLQYDESGGLGKAAARATSFTFYTVKIPSIHTIFKEKTDRKGAEGEEGRDKDQELYPFFALFAFAVKNFSMFWRFPGDWKVNDVALGGSA
jgi:hypothetical protein